MAEELPNLSMKEIQDIAISMSKSATNIYRLLENLLRWSQIQKGALPFKPEWVELKEIVNESIAMVLESAKHKHIEINNQIEEGITVFADNNILQSIVRNLAFNAIKYTHQGGVVNIVVNQRISNHVEITLQDTGIGMSPQMLDDLFRIDIKNNRKGTQGEPGTGLGLLLCKEFIRKLGGEIWVQSEVGKGSSFTFTIPCSAEPFIANHT